MCIRKTLIFPFIVDGKQFSKIKLLCKDKGSDLKVQIWAKQSVVGETVITSGRKKAERNFWVTDHYCFIWLRIKHRRCYFGIIYESEHLWVPACFCILCCTSIKSLF